MSEHPRNRLRTTQGMGLIEVLISSALLGVLVSLCLQMFVTHNRITALNALHLNRLEGLRTVQDSFRESVREAVGIASGVLDYRTGPEQLVLRLPAHDGTPRYAVWGDLDGSDRLSYVCLRLQDPPEVERAIQERLPIENVQFDFGAAPPERARTVTLNYALKQDPGERPFHERPVHRVTATLRGLQETRP